MWGGGDVGLLLKAGGDGWGAGDGALPFEAGGGGLGAGNGALLFEAGGGGGWGDGDEDLLLRVGCSVSAGGVEWWL